METRLSNIFKRHEFDQGHSRKLLQSSISYVYFLKAVEFCPSFDIQIDITLAISRKVAKSHFSESPQESLKIRQSSYQ